MSDPVEERNMGQEGETKEELREELKEVDEQVGDDQSGNPRREKFIELWGDDSVGSTDSTTATTSTSSTEPTTSTTGN